MPDESCLASYLGHEVFSARVPHDGETSLEDRVVPESPEVSDETASIAEDLAIAAAREGLESEQAQELSESHLQVEVDGGSEAVGLDITKARIRDYGAKPLVILFILNAVDEFDRSVLAVALEPIRDYFNVTDTVVSLLPLAFVFLAGVIGVPAGTWADRWVRKYILSAGAVVWAGAGFLAAASQNFFQLFTSRMILGAGQGTIGPTHLSLLSDYYPVEIRGRVLGYHRSANPFGQILGAVIGGFLVAILGWRWAFAMAAIPGLIFGLYALLLREPARGEADLNAATSANPILAEFLKEPEEKAKFFPSLKVIFKIPTLRSLIIANSSVGFALIGVIFWLPGLFERRYGFTTKQASLVLGVLAFATFIGTWYGSPKADRNVGQGFNYMTLYGAKAVLWVTVAWPLAFLIPNPWITATFMALSAGVASYGIPGLVAVVAASAPPRIRSQAFAAFGLALAVCGAAIAPLIIGVISDLLQKWDVNPGDSLRWAMLSSTIIVVGLGNWFIFRASRTAADDINKTIADFLNEMTQGKADVAIGQNSD